MLIDPVMSDKAQFELHALNLGKIVGNLLSLEMGARMAIVKMDERAAKLVQAQLPQMKAGDFVEVNAFTNSDDLTQTLEKLNKRVPLNCQIDVSTIVSLRDALGHGRTFGFGAIKWGNRGRYSFHSVLSPQQFDVSENMTWHDNYFNLYQQFSIPALSVPNKSGRRIGGCDIG